MKKSIVISLLTVTIILATALCSLASTGKVTTDTLRLREQASTDSKTLDLLSVGDEIEILGEETGWYKVKYKDHEGYVAAQYINVLTNIGANTINDNKDENNQEVENTTPVTNNPENTEEANQNNNQEENPVAENVETIDVLVNGSKMYITPLINSLVIKTLEEEKQVEIVSEISGWSYVKCGITSGWVRTENIQKKAVENDTKIPENNNNNSSQKIGYISGSSVNFRKTPNTSGEVITKLTKNAEVKIIKTEDGWAEIEYKGDTGYVSTDYISDKKIETTSRGSSARTANKNTEQNKTKTQSETKAKVAEEPAYTGTVTGNAVVEYAKKYLGYKYVSGGSSPSKGFDCSGFTTYVYKHFGISLSRTSRGQASNGKKVSKENLQIGDIICFSNSRSSKSIGHVGIYIGGGRFIHAANSRKGVITSNVSGDGYYFVTASRVI